MEFNLFNFFIYKFSLNGLTKEDYLREIKKSILDEYFIYDERKNNQQDIQQGGFIPENSEIDCLGQFIPETDSTAGESAEKKINVKDLLKKKLENKLLESKNDVLKQEKKSKKSKYLIYMILKSTGRLRV
jgi:hypothetical protein